MYEFFLNSCLLRQKKSLNIILLLPFDLIIDWNCNPQFWISFTEIMGKLLSYASNPWFWLLFLLFLSSFDNIFLSGLWKKVMSKRTNRPGISTTNRGRGRSRRGGYYRGMGSGYYPYAPRPRPRYRWGIMHWMASFTFHIQLLILQFLLITYQISLNLIFIF